MTGLQVWLHPSSRNENQLLALEKTENQGLPLHATALRRTATVVRNRRRVLDRTDFDPGGCQSAHGRFATRTRAADANVHAADTVIACHVGGIHRRLLSGKRSAFTRSPETERSRALPRQHVAAGVRNGHDGVVERSLNVHQSVRDVLALFLLELFLLAFFVGRRDGAGCCWFW